jgi:hypothetical protein
MSGWGGEIRRSDTPDLGPAKESTRVDENPKAALGRAKAPIQYIPTLSLRQLGVVMYLGAIVKKYGPFNWRERPVAATDYQDAIQRHLDLWFDGEDSDDESKVSHLAHVMACCAILIDAQAHGTMIDDRRKTGVVVAFIKSFGKLLQG